MMSTQQSIATIATPQITAGLVALPQKAKPATPQKKYQKRDHYRPGPIEHKADVKVSRERFNSRPKDEHFFHLCLINNSSKVDISQILIWGVNYGEDATGDKDKHIGHWHKITNPPRASSDPNIRSKPIVLSDPRDHSNANIQYLSTDAKMPGFDKDYQLFIQLNVKNAKPQRFVIRWNEEAGQWRPFFVTPPQERKRRDDDGKVIASDEKTSREKLFFLRVNVPHPTKHRDASTNTDKYNWRNIISIDDFGGKPRSMPSTPETSGDTNERINDTPAE